MSSVKIKDKIKPPKWLDAHSDTQTSLNTLPSCLTLCDLKNDCYHKLICIDMPKNLQQRSKLKVFKGTGMVSEQGLPGIPTAVQSFYIDEPEPKLPIIAVAIGPSILFYRNMKPYYKYTVPGLSVEPLEKDVWRKLSVERPENQGALIESLKSIEISQLTWMSQKLILIPAAERDAFIKEHAELELQRLSTVVAMKTLLRTSSDNKPPSCLVLATENGEILIIDTLVFSIIYQARVCSFQACPSIISLSGQFDTDFRIVIAARDGSLFLLRKTWLEGRHILKLEQPPIGLMLLPIDQTIIVACMDRNLSCYSKKGKKLWEVHLDETPKCMVPIHLPHLGMTLICIALNGGLVQFYSQKHIVDEFKISENVDAMIFGQLGQEEHVLTMITQGGSLLIKILKRTAVFISEQRNEQGNAANHSKALDIPKKSSIFLEQTLREKENSKAIYGSFQVELWRLRLTAARATCEAINSAESTISSDLRHAPIKLAAEICGVGPQFRLFLIIENMSTKKEATNLSVLLHADQRHYMLPKARAKLPLLVPGIPLKVDFEVTAVLDPVDGLPPADLTSENAIVRVMIIKAGQAKPLIAAVVVMPESEAALE